MKNLIILLILLITINFILCQKKSNSYKSSSSSQTSHYDKKTSEKTRTELRELQKEHQRLLEDGKYDEADRVNDRMKSLMQQSRGDRPRRLDAEDSYDYEDYSSRPKSRSDVTKDRRQRDYEKEERFKAILRRRVDDFLNHVETHGYTSEEKQQFKNEIDEYWSLELRLIESRLKLSEEFEVARGIDDKHKRREYLDKQKIIREKRREEDNQIREIVIAKRREIDEKLRERERVEL